jgi:hypothetical protein
MRHPHYSTPRQDHVAAYDLSHAVAAITSNYRARLIARPIAERQLREAGCFEAEITEILN